MAELEPADLAEIFTELDEKDIPIVFRLLPKELAAETFVEMNSAQQELLIKSFSDTELKLMLDELFVDDTVDLIEEMPRTSSSAFFCRRTAKSQQGDQRDPQISERLRGQHHDDGVHLPPAPT